MSEPFVGEIRLFGFNFAPRGWATCQGQLLSIAQNTALFSLLGTVYGGNGQTTFGLPDLRGRTPVGPGFGPGLAPVNPGQQGGAETHVLTSPEMPAHVHTVAPPAATSASSKNPAGRVRGLTAAAAYADAANGALAASNSTVAGGSQPFGTRSPYLGMNYCIALFGVYPSRN